ncbi:2-keto-4-pentenoate hydratase/2-oxohepta-3-ene-1,7-dioic acid hydratase (catechol pathway) [Roseovarius marisflavi]|uniref:2-keto-4-pentenoate hydratase/2-oxohepta-3-ene-1,7-dioic acid hydratase (Catechol pathway) n=1 Tax=Roseovarius marisflavi TaxID=1054996 RepID=A0A1M6WF09_9RHOB|nr:fumarylacetoacetate hydrolase family protein [Roseovarius marisflavi]SHK92176.1 2-keto-4-pentenoate hydratase/2-oxohepta-3-ene-1,7-dioic acid hydratase (catechol pathway) [Roseovarius marisflavi]
MKFARCGAPGQEKPAVVDGAGNLRDLSGVLPDLAGAVLGDLPAVNPESLPLVQGNPRLGPPVGNVGKLICIGLNYIDHAAELGVDPPKDPVVFLKATSSIVGAHDTVVLPRGSKRGDWEVELGIVIGKRAKYVSEETALDHVAGYTIVNDVSERGFQLERSGQWTKGKSCDTFAPMGPWLVTPDEVGDPQNLDLSVDVNGERMQTGNTRLMIFTVAQIVAYLSELMTLEPGDVIATGTPPGVGMGHKPPRYLSAGDEMVLRISGLGEQRSPVAQDR